MSSLDERPELVGFFSYSREDDAGSYGALSALRERIQNELSLLLGRSPRDFRLWQDKEAIAPGKLWESEIRAAVAQAVFFIPIITPRAVRSEYCRFEFDAFLARESALGRDDLIFPILYARVPALGDSARWQRDHVLAVIGRRQYVDWQKLRLFEVTSTPVREAIDQFCRKIVEALERPGLSEAEIAQRQAEAPELAQKKHQAEEAARLAEQERQAEEAARLAEDKRQAEETARLAEQERQAEEAVRLAAERRQAEEAARLAEEKRREAPRIHATESDLPRQWIAAAYDTAASETGLRVGIDLGTTNSRLAVVRPGDVAEVVPNKEQEEVTPSVVGLSRRRHDATEQTGRYLVGRAAMNNSERAPENTIRSIKRFIGLTFTNPLVQIAQEHVAYDIQAAPDGRGGVAAKIGEKLLTPEEISAMILRKLKEDAEARLGSPVTQAVITVPAYFEEPRRRATRNAGALAGLTVLAILDEPTAAAISEGVDETDNARVLVFDFGGSTLDISLIIQAEGKLHVRGYAGDAFLGGDDIDRAIADHIRANIVENGGMLKERDASMDVVLQERAEAAKKTLASGKTAEILIPAVCRTKDGDIFDLDMTLTQEDFASVLHGMLERVRRLLEKFLVDEGLSPSHVAEVLMVGGSSAVTPFRVLLEDMFESDGTKRVKLARSPMEAVAKGAATYAGRLRALICPSCHTENDIAATECSNCKAEFAQAAAEMELPRSLGVAYGQGDNPDAFQVILKKGTRYPLKEPVFETFRVPAATSFKISVREGDSSHARENTLVGVIKVEKIPSDVDKDAPVEIAFNYMSDRTLFVHLRYPTSKTRIEHYWKLAWSNGGWQGNFEHYWKLAPSDGETQNHIDPLRTLCDLLPLARVFASDYDQFMEPGARRMVAEILNCASQAVLDGNKDEATRLRNDLVQSMMQECGIASTLFVAENIVVVREDKALGKAVMEMAAKLRRNVAANEPNREETRQALDDVILRVLSERINAPTIDSLFGERICIEEKTIDTGHVRSMLKLPWRDGSAGSDNDPTRWLGELLPRARAFASDYGQFMDAGARKMVAEYLNRAQKAVQDDNKDEAARVSSLLLGAMFGGCGIASTLFLAETTAANEDVQIGDTILGGAKTLREQVAANDPQREAMRRDLDLCIAHWWSLWRLRIADGVAVGDIGGEATLIR